MRLSESLMREFDCKKRTAWSVLQCVQSPSTQKIVGPEDSERPRANTISDGQSRMPAKN
jgi:hypothetical protein